MDFGIQTCLDAKYTIVQSVGTQTEEVLPTAVSTADASVQVDELHSEDRRNIAHDHSYATMGNQTLPEIYPCDTDSSDSDGEDNEHYEKTYSDNSAHLSDFSNNDMEVDDDDYQPPSEEEACSSSAETGSDDETSSYENESKFVVFRSSLQYLLNRCSECGECVIRCEETTMGSMLVIRMTCVKGHTVKWNSQPMIGSTPVGNLMIAASILFTGSTFTPINNFASCLGLKLFSERVFYDIQARYLFPVVNNAWENERQELMNALRVKEQVNLNGDGRCDSPGHSAKYGTYTLMDDDTGKVVSFNVVQVTEVTSSNAMEKEGFERCVTSLEGDGVQINRIATDRHVSISSCMDKQHRNIKHQYDVWHVSKSVTKKLTKKGQLKGCHDILPWIKSISNHLWWCSATCEGNVQLMQEKWKSVVHHVVNKHSWSNAQLFHKCAHRRITPARALEVSWLAPGSPSEQHLEEVVCTPKLLKDMAKLTEFCHTGQLEVYHSMMLKYCPKREHFSYRGMVARTQLAALDNNANTGRQQTVIKAGERAGVARFSTSFPKAHRQWVVKPILEKKNYGYLTGMMRDVLRRVELGNAARQPAPVLPRNIASEPAPDKEHLIQQHRSRFNRR